MGLTEFSLIDRYFRQCGARRTDVTLGVGDDAAMVAVPAGKQLVVATDTLVEGSHFPAGSPADSIGHRALAVNLSDLAAMGAEPAWALLALTLPDADETWLESFTRGFASLAREHLVALIGGDTTSGPLSITVTALGFADRARVLTRSGGKPGDAVWVSGTPGDAAYGLRLELRCDRSDRRDVEGGQQDLQALRNRFCFPTPRVALGRSLVGLASACIDVSDGLLADARKLAEASGCALEVDVDSVPISAQLQRVAGIEEARLLAMTGGEDYELCFSVPATGPASIPGCHRIGMLHGGQGVRVHASGGPVHLPDAGFDHFADR